MYFKRNVQVIIACLISKEGREDDPWESEDLNRERFGN